MTFKKLCKIVLTIFSKPIKQRWFFGLTYKTTGDGVAVITTFDPDSEYPYSGHYTLPDGTMNHVLWDKDGRSSFISRRDFDLTDEQVG